MCGGLWIYKSIANYLQVYQRQNEHGPQLHLINKRRILTLAGIPLFLYAGYYSFVSVAYFTIGVWDDLLKCYGKQRGITYLQRLLVQMPIFLQYLFYNAEISVGNWILLLIVQCGLLLSVVLQKCMRIGCVIGVSGVFLAIFTQDIILFYHVMFLWVFINAVNVADGLDGLIALPLATAFVFYGQYHLAAVMFGYLMFNNPFVRTNLFMGDSGALFFGAILAEMILQENWKHVWCVGIVPIIALGSSLLQIVSWKVTGKRMFTIAPVHHSFEQKYGEKVTVMGFWLIHMLCLLMGCMMRS